MGKEGKRKVRKVGEKRTEKLKKERIRKIELEKEGKRKVRKGGRIKETEKLKKEGKEKVKRVGIKRIVKQKKERARESQKERAKKMVGAVLKWLRVYTTSFGVLIFLLSKFLSNVWRTKSKTNFSTIVIGDKICILSTKTIQLLVI